MIGLLRGTLSKNVNRIRFPYEQTFFVNVKFMRFSEKKGGNLNSDLIDVKFSIFKSRDEVLDSTKCLLIFLFFFFFTEYIEINQFR